MYYITTLPKYFPVSSAIRKALQEKLDRRILISRREHIIRRYGKIILNVGTAYNYKHLFINDKVINLPEVCSLSGNKLRTLSLFSNYVPTVEIKHGIPENYPVLKRNDINSFHGKGIEFITSEENFWEPGYYSPYISFSTEYRIMIVVFSNEIKMMRVFRKDLLPEYENELFVPRNAEHCKYYRISNPKMSKLPDFLNGIIGAMSNFKNYYLGLDVGRIGKELVLIETNSAPGMNSITIDEFIDVIINELGI